MYLERISLPVLDVEDVAGFYRSTLCLPVLIEESTAVVTVGRTRLDLRTADTVTGPHHLAMTIPTGSFAAARAWLEDRTQLLSRDGEDEFEGPSGWNSRSLYFDGPEGAVLELIERRDRPPGRSSTFSARELTCVSEVGIAVPDVDQAASGLSREAGIETYGQPATPEFAAVGDMHGLLILVRPGRVWLPTTDRLAVETPTTVAAVGPRPGTYPLGASTAVHVG